MPNGYKQPRRQYKHPPICHPEELLDPKNFEKGTLC